MVNTMIHEYSLFIIKFDQLNRYDFVSMIKCSLLVRMYDLLLINDNKLSLMGYLILMTGFNHWNLIRINTKGPA